jgi:predicted metal-dependent peptidase
LQDRLVQARRNEPDESLAAACEAMQRAHAGVQDTVVRLGNQVKERNPELIDLALERASQASNQLSREIENARSRAHDIRIALEAKGQLGLGEKLELLQGQLVLAEVELNWRKRRADAIALLRSTMQKAERRAKEQTSCYLGRNSL